MSRRYKYDEWDFRFGECGYHDPDQNVYTDLDGKPVTGILEGFYSFKAGDPKNDQYVENGKRLKSK